jgi:probable phosphoglycerate mutase
MKRTVGTADILARPHHLTPISKDGLREIDHGRWEGLRRRDVKTRFPEEFAAWEADPFTLAPQGGETGMNVLARARPVLHDLVTAHEGQLILVVSHKATIRLLISNLLGFDPRGFRDRLTQSPACLNVLDFTDPLRARLTLFNDVSHYAGYPTLDPAYLSKEWENPSS